MEIHDFVLTILLHYLRVGRMEFTTEAVENSTNQRGSLFQVNIWIVLKNNGKMVTITLSWIYNSINLFHCSTKPDMVTDFL